MRALAEAVSRKMGRMYSVFDLNFAQAFLDAAEGQYLNFIGDMMGVSRLGEQAATVTSQDRDWETSCPSCKTQLRQGL